MIYLKTEEEIELIRESSLLVGKTLAEVAKLVEPGVTPLEFDQRAEEFIKDHGGVPGFKGYGGFPNTLCTSVNEQVVHGIPSNKPLQNGDIISVDCGVLLNEFYGDVAYTFEVGEVADNIKMLLETTKACLKAGIEAAKAGNRIGDIGYAVQSLAEKEGFGVVRELVGHGLGKNLHESPEVPNYGRRGNGLKLKEGLVLAIEPMINLGKRNVKQAEDGWTIITADKHPSAHFEHDVVVRKDGAEVLSTHEFIEEELNKKKNK
jgi:methionyl aminopeptidase